MSEIAFLDMKRLTSRYAAELKRACAEVIDSGRFLNGEQTAAFERELAASCGAKHCVALSNGLDALRLSLRAWVERGLAKPGDEVIVAANTYVASVLAICDASLKPILVDPEPLTMNLDPEKTAKAVSSHTRAIMEVHLYGTPVLHSRIREIADSHGLLIIEDNAQAIGAAENGLHTGAMGDVGTFSFYPTKNIGALGDAGAVTTDDQEQANAVRALANYGSDRRYHNIYKGFNCRMDEMQAAMLRVKLRHLADETARRQEMAKLYDRLITNPEIAKPAHLPTMTQVWHQYVVLSRRRDSLRQFLAENGVQTDIHYATPPHRQPCFDALEHGALPLTEKIADEAVSLPIASVNEKEVRYIAELINNFN